MKKMIFVLAVLFVTAPAMAGVVVEVVDLAAGCQVNINYDANGTGNIRAFGLDITADGGATIDAIDGLSADYVIYPGSIVINNNEVNDYGTPVASGVGALEGLGYSGITIEMGSLYEMGVDPAPAATGTLCTLTLSGLCNVSIAENTARGGVVMEDPSADADPTLNGGAVTECAPACWSHTCQPQGDATTDGLVNFADLNVLKQNIFKPSTDPTYDPCADFTQDGMVNFADLNALKQGIFQPCP